MREPMCSMFVDPDMIVWVCVYVCVCDQLETTEFLTAVRTLVLPKDADPPASIYCSSCSNENSARQRKGPTFGDGCCR